MVIGDLFCPSPKVVTISNIYCITNGSIAVFYYNAPNPPLSLANAAGNEIPDRQQEAGAAHPGRGPHRQ